MGMRVPLVRRLRGAPRRAQSLVEFALIAPVLFLLLFGILEFGLLLHAYITMQHAVDEAARYAVTGEGYDLAAGAREAAIIAVASKAAGTLMIDPAAFANEAGHFRVGIRSSSSGTNPAENDAGKADDFVRVTIDFNHPTFTFALASAGAYVPLHTEALVLNERFARPTGEVGDLPPEPRPTATPSGPCYTLITGVAEGTGSVSASPPPNCAGGQYPAGMTVSLIASPAGTFIGWEGDVSGGAVTSVVMNNNKRALARFSESTYTLTVSVSGDGSGTVSPAPGVHTYHEGDVVTLSATAGTGSEFAGWAGAVSGTASPVSLTITGNASVTAEFARNTYTLQVFRAGSGSGTMNPAEGSHTYARGTVVALEPGTPDAGSVFVGWICGGYACTSVTMDGDKAAFARFERDATP